MQHDVDDKSQRDLDGEGCFGAGIRYAQIFA